MIYFLKINKFFARETEEVQSTAWRVYHRGSNGSVNGREALCENRSSTSTRVNKPRRSPIWSVSPIYSIYIAVSETLGFLPQLYAENSEASFVALKKRSACAGSSPRFSASWARVKNLSVRAEYRNTFPLGWRATLRENVSAARTLLIRGEREDEDGCGTLYAIAYYRQR